MSKIGKTVINLSRTKLNESELKLLDKGLNYIPTPKSITKIPILEAANQFGHRLKLTHRYHRSTYNYRPKFVEK